MKIARATYNLNVLERTSNKIDKTSYNLYVLEVLRNIFQAKIFATLKKKKKKTTSWRVNGKIN